MQVHCDKISEYFLQAKQNLKQSVNNFEGNWDTQEGEQAFRSNPNGIGDRTTTLRRLLIGADTAFC